jgi:hypothetical protein
MEAQINDRQLSKFRPLLQEDQVYYIKHFLVLAARKVYRQVENDYMIRSPRSLEGIQTGKRPSIFSTICAPRGIFSHLAFTRWHKRIHLRSVH